MLTVYSTQGSPGASTTALHLAAHWASMGREVLLIEADPAGGSLSRNLGIQFTPGSASFVASGLPVLSSNLIDHAQDVLFENLHVMPAPATPAGATGIFRTFADSSDDLRAISENEMAVIIDGGRITADTAVSMLTTGAAGVLVVCRDNSQLSSLEPLREVFAAGPEHDGPHGFVTTIGKSALDDEEWLQSYGLTFCGAIGVDADMAADIAGHLNRNKRKSKKWRHGLERVGEKLYPVAQPPPSGRSREPRPAEQPAPRGTEPADDAGPAAAAPPAYEPRPPDAYAPEAYAPTQYPPPVYEPGSPEAYPAGHHLPPAYGSAPSEAYPPAQYPPEAYEQGSEAGVPGHYLPPAYGSAPSEAYPPAQYPPEAYPPEAPAPEAYAHETYAPGHYPPLAYEPDPPEAYAPDHYPPAGYEQEPHPNAHPPAHGQVPPPVGEQPGSGMQPLASEPLPTPDIQPSGSFRDWAAKLHGSKAEDQAAQNQGV
ncbi:MAG: hypothetical protein F4Y05_02340 [Acidimicrobiaceae bacterium]|nr:hypothetical protein [Acidimicrobiaceae bacterium]